MGFFLTAAEESAEAVEEVIEEVLQYNIDDVYRVLSECSDKLSTISNQLGELQETGTELLQLLRSSELDSICALLLLLVFFKLLMVVKSWLKGVRRGRIS